MRKEERNRSYFSMWLNNIDGDMLKIYYDYKQIHSANVFNVTGTNGSKPDIVICKKVNDFVWNIAIEFKSGSTNEITTGFYQIQKYALDYHNGKSKYYVNGNEIKIHSFILASPNSVEGYLYNKEEYLENLKLKHNPYNRAEKPMTFLLWRLLYRAQQELNLNVKLGIIIAQNKKPFVIQENKFIPLAGKKDVD